MEHHRGGRKRNIGKGYYPCVVPALAFGVIHDEHVVGKMLAESERGRVRFGFGSGCFCDSDIHIFVLSRRRTPRKNLCRIIIAANVLRVIVNLLILLL